VDIAVPLAVTLPVELGELFKRLGYPFGYATIPKNIAYYAPRTSNGSTLGRVVDSWVLARSSRARSWEIFKEALESDIADIQGGTTPEGIHLGAMAGVVDLLQRGYAGIETRSDTLWLNPCLPDEVTRLEMVIRYRGQGLDLSITQDTIDVHALPSNAIPITIGVVREIHEIAAGERRRFLTDGSSAPRSEAQHN